MNNLILWLQPIFTAFTGWFTIWLATYLLVHPRKPVRLLGFTIQGIISQRQKTIAEKFGIMAQDLIQFGEIAEKLNDPDILKDLAPLIDQHLDTFLEVKLQEKLPVISSFIGPSTVQKLKEGMQEEIEILLPEIISQYTHSLAGKIDIQHMVAEKITRLSANKLEETLQIMIKKELRNVKILGAVVGLIIGIIQLCFSFL